MTVQVQDQDELMEAGGKPSKEEYCSGVDFSNVMTSLMHQNQTH